MCISFQWLKANSVTLAADRLGFSVHRRHHKPYELIGGLGELAHDVRAPILVFGHGSFTRVFYAIVFFWGLTAIMSHPDCGCCGCFGPPPTLSVL